MFDTPPDIYGFRGKSEARPNSLLGEAWTEPRASGRILRPAQFHYSFKQLRRQPVAVVRADRNDLGVRPVFDGYMLKWERLKPLLYGLPAAYEQFRREISASASFFWIWPARWGRYGRDGSFLSCPQGFCSCSKQD